MVLLLGAAMYVVLLALLTQLVNSHQLPWILVILGFWSVLLLVATIVVIVASVMRIRTRQTRQVASDAIIAKLASIPFFVVNFAALFSFLLVGAVMAVFADPVLGIAGTMGIGVTYLTLLSTSIPVWATIAQLRRERTIGTGLTVLYALLSLVFVTDIAAGVMVFGHSRRRPRLALMWLTIATGATVIGLGLIVLLASLGMLGFLGDFGYFFDSSLQHLPTWIPINLIAIGIGVILVAIIVSALRRSTLRLEARAARAAETPTARDSSLLSEVRGTRS